MNRDYATAAVGLAFVVVCFFTHLVYIFVNKTVRKVLKSIFCCSKAEDENDYSNVNTNKVAIESLETTSSEKIGQYELRKSQKK